MKCFLPSKSYLKVKGIMMNHQIHLKCFRFRFCLSNKELQNRSSHHSKETFHVGIFTINLTLRQYQIFVNMAHRSSATFIKDLMSQISNTPMSNSTVHRDGRLSYIIFDCCGSRIKIKSES